MDIDDPFTKASCLPPLHPLPPPAQPVPCLPPSPKASAAVMHMHIPMPMCMHTRTASPRRCSTSTRTPAHTASSDRRRPTGRCCLPWSVATCTCSSRGRRSCRGSSTVTCCPTCRGVAKSAALVVPELTAPAAWGARLRRWAASTHFGGAPRPLRPQRQHKRHRPAVGVCQRRHCYASGPAGAARALPRLQPLLPRRGLGARPHAEGRLPLLPRQGRPQPRQRLRPVCARGLARARRAQALGARRHDAL